MAGGRIYLRDAGAGRDPEALAENQAYEPLANDADSTLERPVPGSDRPVLRQGSMDAVTIELSPIAARVLGSLVEKEITTPEYYPLSLNALSNACNQKSNRDPVLHLEEYEVRKALNHLESQSLVRSVSARD